MAEMWMPSPLPPSPHALFRVLASLLMRGKNERHSERPIIKISAYESVENFTKGILKDNQYCPSLGNVYAGLPLAFNGLGMGLATALC